MATHVVGTRGTSTQATETIAVRDVASRIAMLQPESAPMLTFTNSLKGKKEAKNFKFEWFEDELCGNTVAETSGATTTTSLVVSSGDALKLRVYDVLVAPNGENILITAFTDATQTTMTVTRSIGAVAAYSIAANTQLVVAGNASDEGSGQPAARTTQRVPQYNFIQIFKDIASVTDTANAVEEYSEEELRIYLRKKVAVEHKRSIEQAFLFGDKAEIAGGYGNSRRTTSGLVNLISTNVTDCGGVLTEADFEAFLRTVFRYKPADGSGSKVLFACPIMISALNFWAKSALEVRQDEKLYGMRISTYRSGHGDLDIVPHWLLGDFTEFTKWNFVIDPAGLKYRFLRGLDTKLHLDTGLKSSEVKTDEYRTHAGLQLELEKTCGILKGMTGFGA